MELRAFAAAGGQALARWTPMGLGRCADELPALSEATGVRIIAATGLHQAGHYAPKKLPVLLDGLAERFIAELGEGLRTDAEPDGPPFPDPGPHREAAEAGAFLCFDGPSRANNATDWRLFDCLAALIEAGHADQILLGGDTTSVAARASSGGGPGIPFLLTDIRARIIRDFGPGVADAVFRRNPARAFDADWLV